MDASGLTNVDTTQRVASFPRAAAVSWPPSFQARASNSDTANASGAQSRQQGGQPPPQSAPAAAGLAPSGNAAFLAQSLSQEANGNSVGDNPSSFQAAATAYGRLAAAAPQPDNTVEVLTAMPQLASGRAVDLTV